MVEETPLSTVDTADLDRRGGEIVDAANSLMVDSAESLIGGERLVVAIKAAEAHVHTKLDLGCAKANDLHKHLTGQRREYLDPLAKARAIAVDKTSAYRAAEERKRRVEEVRLRAEAKQQAEMERLAEAEALEKAGRATEAEAVINEPVLAPPVVLARTVPKSDLRYRKMWYAEVTDLAALIRHAASFAGYQQYLQENMTALNGAARAAKTEESHIPGVAFRSRTGA